MAVAVYVQFKNIYSKRNNANDSVIFIDRIPNLVQIKQTYRTVHSRVLVEQARAKTEETCLVFENCFIEKNK